MKEARITKGQQMYGDELTICMTLRKAGFDLKAPLNRYEDMRTGDLVFTQEDETSVNPGSRVSDKSTQRGD